MPVRMPDSKSSIATDPLRNFKFRVILSPLPNNKKDKVTDVSVSFTNIGFMSVAGFTMNTEVIPYREGGNNTTTRKMPGQTDFAPITLTRGVTLSKNSQAMYNWMRTIFNVNQGLGTKRNGANPNFRTNFVINVLEHPVTQWNVPGPLGGKGAGGGVNVKMKIKVYNAWPSTLTYSDFDAGGNAVLIQSMVLQHEGWAVMHATSGDPDLTNNRFAV